jgi:hypothetical protein
LADAVIGSQRSLFDRWCDRAYRAVPRPHALASRNGRPPVRSVLVLRKGNNPTYSYYFEARLKALAPLPYQSRCIDSESLESIDPAGLFVIICRYIKPAQLRWLERHRSELAGVALFIDDDIAALLTGTEAVWHYRLYLASMTLLPLRRLNRLLTHVWASTPALKEALAAGGRPVSLLPPAPDTAEHLPLSAKSSKEPVSVAFHATGVHGREHRFLVPIAQRVIARHPHVRFDILAQRDDRKLWLSAGLPEHQLRIVPLMRWPEYHRHSRETGADIFAVPLMDNRENAARADTKRIDCARLGAAAIFSDSPAYSSRRHPGEIHIGNNPDIWVETLLDLADNPQRRDKAAQATRDVVAAMADDLRFPDLDLSPSPPR